MANYLNFESHGIFVYRSWNRIKDEEQEVSETPEGSLECRQVLQVICVEDSSAARNPIPYNTYRYNECQVRIPSILWLHKVSHMARHPIDPMAHFRDNYRQQLGTHVFLLEREVMFVQTSLSRAAADAQPRYTVSTSRPINSVYPVLRNPQTGGKLSLGLFFCQQRNIGDRDQVYFRTRSRTSGGVFDVTEDFFDELHNALSNGSEPNWKNTTPKVSRGYNHFAIYVGAGARLVVEDYRSIYKTAHKTEWQGTSLHEDEVTFSLFQQGSLVIVEGQLDLSIPIHHPITKRNCAKNCFAALRDRDYFPKGIPADLDYQIDPKNEKIVIILGATPSLHNTISWHLRVPQCLTAQERPSMISTLTVPEGGRIQACLPWVEGFHEVYWRHRYECLYEAVLRSQTFGGNYTPKYGRTQPTPAMTKLILGSDSYFTGQPNQRDFQMNFSSTITQCLADYVDYSLRYPFTEIERVTERLAAAPPSVPPIMLPIALGDNLVYFEPGLLIEHNTQTDVYTIRGIEYRKKSNVFTEYEWKPIGYLHYYQTNRHLIGNWTDLPLKCGIDYIVYQKTQKLVGVMHSYYLEAITLMDYNVVT